MTKLTRGMPAIAGTPGAPLLPRPSQLAGLGTVLCLYRSRRGSELAGWMQAVRAESTTSSSNEGLQECLSFVDLRGQCCWRLFLLPDSDFLAWDMLAATFPAHDAASRGAGLWRRLVRRMDGNGWRFRVLRLHVLVSGSTSQTLVASPAPVSALGATTARRIARREGAAGEVHPDQCHAPAEESPP
ncbi:Hemin transport protein [Pseudoxanthomonas sp. NC8]|nr:Hemin transport protein [Pseudoxanthomonas sp. NC8]